MARITYGVKSRKQLSNLIIDKVMMNWQMLLNFPKSLSDSSFYEATAIEGCMTAGVTWQNKKDLASLLLIIQHRRIILFWILQIVFLRFLLQPR